MTPKKKYSTLLVATDLSPVGTVAVAASDLVAEELESQRIHLVHVVSPLPAWVQRADYGGVPRDPARDAIIAAREALDHLVAHSSRFEFVCDVRVGRAAEQIAIAAKDVHADLIVIATHGRGPLGRAVFGSVASTVVRTAPCPVLIVGQDRRGPTPLRKILTAVDLSPISGRVLKEAISLAEKTNATVDLVTVFEVPEVTSGEDVLPHFTSPKEVDALRQQHQAQLNKLIKATESQSRIESEVIISSQPADALLTKSESMHANLIVLGSSGHSAWENLFLGSTAIRVIAESKCAVLVVPA